MGKKFEKSMKALTIEDFDENDIVVKSGTIISVKETETEYGERDFLVLENNNNEKIKLFLNQTSVDALIEAYGPDSGGWENKIVNVKCIKAKKGQYKGKMLIVEPITAQKV